MPPVGGGQAFIIVPVGHQAGSLEWAHYADLVAQQLTSRGYIKAVGATPIKYAVFFSYAIDRGKSMISSLPVYGQTGGGTTATFYSGSGSGYAYTQPTYGEIGSELVATTVFTRTLELEIFDASTFQAGMPAGMQEQSTTPPLEIFASAMASAKAFEAKANSAGLGGNLAIVMPPMIAAVFKDFPGKSGETISISAPLQR
jgi:hypothetical protein